MVKVDYHFPLWLLTRSISVRGLFPRNDGPELLLKIYRTVPLGNLPLRLAIKGDLPGLTKLLDEGVANVNDSNTNYYSLLEVSENFFPTPPLVYFGKMLSWQRRQSTMST
jgi:hypothetical protein